MNENRTTSLPVRGLPVLQNWECHSCSDCCRIETATMPNVNLYEEMVDLMAASRSYEANLDVVKTARSMALQTLSIGKR